MAPKTRGLNLSGMFITGAAAVLFAFSAPAIAQDRPNPGTGSGEHAVPRGGESSSPSAPAGGTSSSSGGSSVGSGGGGGDHAISRGGERGGRGGAREGSGAARGGGSPKSVVVPAGSGGGYSSEPARRGEPGRPATGEYSRPRGNRPAIDHAVPRSGNGDISNVPIPPNWSGDYWNYWYYSYYNPYYRYGYYPCMPSYYGCFYYDPFFFDYYYGYTPGYYGGGGGYSSSSQADYDTGAVKLKVKPRDAQVYVDGYFSGIVDDYDGVLQKLKLPAGTHRIELRADEYQPSTFDVLVAAGETVTYRAELKPRPKA